jgi:hypothetical protein
MRDKYNPLAASHGSSGKNEDLAQAMNETNYWKQPKDHAKPIGIGKVADQGNLKI